MPYKIAEYENICRANVCTQKAREIHQGERVYFNEKLNYLMHEACAQAQYGGASTKTVQEKKETLQETNETLESMEGQLVTLQNKILEAQRKQVKAPIMNTVEEAQNVIEKIHQAVDETRDKIGELETELEILQNIDRNARFTFALSAAICFFAAVSFTGIIIMLFR